MLSTLVQKQEPPVGQHQQSIPCKYSITHVQNKINHFLFFTHRPLCTSINGIIILPVTFTNKPKTLFLHFCFSAPQI